MINLEEWRKIPGFPGYKVSNLGRVLTYRGKAKRVGGRIALQHIVGNSTKYFIVSLMRDRSRKYIKVHRAVLFAFVGEPPLGHEAMHLDGNGMNNSLDNLAWGTHKENMAERLASDTYEHGVDHMRTNLSEAQVIEIVQRARNGESPKDIAEGYPVSYPTIRSILRGYTWSRVTGIKHVAKARRSWLASGEVRL